MPIPQINPINPYGAFREARMQNEDRAAQAVQNRLAQMYAANQDSRSASAEQRAQAGFDATQQANSAQIDMQAREQVAGWANNLLSRQDIDDNARVQIIQQAVQNPATADVLKRAGVAQIDWNNPQQVIQGIRSAAGWGAKSQQMRPPPTLNTQEGPYGSRIVTYGDNLQIIKDPSMEPKQTAKPPVGYQWQGSELVPVPGGPADPNSTGTQRSASTQLRKEFNNLPQVKDYRLVLPLYERASTAPDTRAGDISLIYALGKMFDPGSVVREGELTLSQNAAPWLQKYAANVKSQVARTGRVDAATRTEILAALQGQIESLRGPYEMARSDYAQYASDYGIDPGLILGTDPKEIGQKQPAPSKQKITEGSIIEDTNGQRMILRGNKWVPL